MPLVIAAGITTYYEVHGSGPALLMMGSGSFDSTVERFSSNEWKGIRPFETFARHYTCIPYDRREAGRSGGRVERITYRSYADQAKGLLDHLGFHQAYVLGVCMGASVAITMAVAYPETVAGMVLHKPVGGPRWAMAGHERFNTHHLFVKERGLDAVVELAREKRTFNNAPQAGPWAVRPPACAAPSPRRFRGKRLPSQWPPRHPCTRLTRKPGRSPGGRAVPL